MTHRRQSRHCELLLRTVFALAILSLPVTLSAQEAKPTTPLQQQAAEELNKAGAAYRNGNFAEAQQHSERALQLDPENSKAPMYIARTIHAQYRPGLETIENQDKAREAILAYQRILGRFPSDEESYKAIAHLYAVLKEDDLLRDWVLKRAGDSSIQADKRAEAYVVTASKDWDCSFKITELPTHKITTVTRNKAVVKYLKPKDEAEFEQAQLCANRGLEMVELAIALAPENVSAWSYKTNLLLELAKLAEMAGDDVQKSILHARHEEALKQHKKLSKEAQERTEKAESERVSPKPS